nr:probable protein phosphatase 2C 80 [Tanacetum cinerariifolium]
MPTGSLSKINIPLGFGLRRSVFSPDISNKLSLKRRKFLIPKSVSDFGNLRKDCQITVAASTELIVDNIISICGNVSSFTRPTGRYVERNSKGFRAASVGMKSREVSKGYGVHGYYIFGIAHMASSSLSGKRYNTSSSTCYSDGVSDRVLKESSLDDTITSLAIEADGKSVCGKTLKLLSGSSYLLHPDKEATCREDAHFFCVDEQVIGVSDGVGGWADVEINAGLYSRSLVFNSVRAIRGGPKDAIDPANVLAKAHSVTIANGSSTACIIALKEEDLHAINPGDSGFVVIKDGCTIFQSPVQQDDFNFTYQLANGNEDDQPSSGQVFKILLAVGDIIVARTDGLFDNLYISEVTALVV